MTSVPGPNDPDTAYPHVTPAASGGGAGLPVWFRVNNGGAEGSPIHPEWALYTDGLPTPEDAEVDTDITKVKILTAGTYLAVCRMLVMPNEAGDLVQVQLSMSLNDDSVGPLYDVNTQGKMMTGNAQVPMEMTVPLVLAENDLLTVTIQPLGHPCTVSDGFLHLVRLG